VVSLSNHERQASPFDTPVLSEGHPSTGLC